MSIKVFPHPLFLVRLVEKEVVKSAGHTVGVVEGAVFIKDGSLVTLSELIQKKYVILSCQKLKNM